jgi:hypothetical protein
MRHNWSATAALSMAALTLLPRPVAALESIFPVTTTPPAGWVLDARNGTNTPDVGGTGPSIAGPHSSIRICASNIYNNPYTTSAAINPSEGPRATNQQFKYSLNSFTGSEIAFGTRVMTRGYAGAEPGGDCIMSIAIPGGPGIAVLAGQTGCGMNADIPGSRNDSGFHLYQFRQSSGQVSPNVAGVDYHNLNIQGATRKIADLLIYPNGGISSSGGSWNTNDTYHTFWLYVNKDSKRVIASVDGTIVVDTVLAPLNRQFAHDATPSSTLSNDLNVYSVALATDWDTTGYAQFGARDYDVHSELPQWIPQPGMPGYYYIWGPGQNSPTPYGNTDGRWFFGGTTGDGPFNGNAAILTTNLASTPFANLAPVGEVLTDGSVEFGGTAWTAFATGALDAPAVQDAAAIALAVHHPTPATSCGTRALVASQSLIPDGSTAGAWQTVAVRPGYHYTLSGKAAGGLAAGTGLWEVGVMPGAWDPNKLGTADAALAWSGTLTGNKEFTWGSPDPFLAPFSLSFVPESSNVTVFVRYQLNGGDYTTFGAYFDCLSLVGPVACNSPIADANGDHVVDMLDFATLQLCYNAPGGTAGSTVVNGYLCACFDRGGTSGAIDQADVAQFNLCASGPAIAWVATPTCPQ